MSDLSVNPHQRLQWAEDDYRYYARHLEDTQWAFTEAERQFERAKAELDAARLEYNRHQVEHKMADFINGT